MKKLIIILSLIFSMNAYAASLQPSDAELIKAAGIPVFPGAVFVIGNENVGFHFASSALPEEVQKWYRQQLPEWTLQNEYGSWNLYNGASDIDIEELMSKNQITVKYNDDFPRWYSLDQTRQQRSL